MIPSSSWSSSGARSSDRGARGRTPPGLWGWDSSAWFSGKTKRAVSPPIQVQLGECVLSGIAENAASIAYYPDGTVTMMRRWGPF